ncbi:MAG: cadherin domain-containing protein, partial [Chloroflexaceae bacterium]|nr:cadherin domain-containing protein [Chloroflexaceae bacterium]
MDHAHGQSRHLHVLTRRPRLFGGLLALVALLLGIAGASALLANPIVTVQLQGASIPEGNSGTSTATFTVNLSQALGSGQQIVLGVTTDAGPSNQATAGASCGPGVDYVSNLATLTFNPGDVSQTFAVTICGDTVDELNESFIVRVTVQSSTVGTVQPPVGQSTQVVAIITDDDNPTVQSISAPTALEHAGPLNFVVTLSAVPIENVVIAYSTGAGGDTATATTACPAVGDATQDYVGVANGTLVIPAGQQTGTIAIQVCDDAIPEPPGTETMTLVLDPLNSFSVNLPFQQTTATGTIQDSNAAPAIPAGQTFNVNENSPVGTVVNPAPGQITVNDPDGPGTTFTVTGGTGQGLFNVNAATGAISTNQVFNFETPPTSYTLTVQVCDGGTPNRCASGTVTININDVNDPPTVTGATFSIAENSPAGTAVGTVTATDPDLPPQTLTYSITAGNTGGAFAINAGTGQITVAGALDFETTPSYALTVQVCDTGTPSQCGTGTVTINVTDVNEAPTVTGATFSIAENSPAGTAVGTVTATDPDLPPQTLTYSIT